MSANEAITASQQLMYGHKWELFCLRFSFVGWALLSVLTLGIGYLFLSPYTAATETAFYRSIANSHAGSTYTHHTRPEEPKSTPWDY